ncbi:uncharacterized protein LOC130995594 [Salvia miltiorrhiza]|uniref:uncharacterized protein LOC130995594 n=1 Tax=Salvia miltiorrhiza TaxID=226208 RepID=UPI0025AC93BE|nr:uncharacterized protein LOC130995594 [Salvia miltiorrhiza]
MVLGMKSKHKKGVAVRVEYIVHIQEIRPWPPSETLRSVQTVLIQWENGSESSGSFLSVAGESNIVFDESFMLPTTLYWKKAREKFRKNYLEFSLFEPRKDKVRGHLLGTASLNLADYGLMEDILGLNVPLTFKKSSNNSVHPALAITLELIEKDRSYSSPSVGFSNEASLDGGDDDDSEMASYTDDDVSSRSSRTAGSSAFELGMTSPSQSEKSGFGKPSSAGASSDTWKKVKRYVSSSKLTERSMSFVKKSSSSPLIISSPSSTNFQDSSGELYDTSKSTQQILQEKSFDRLAHEAMSADHYGEHGAKSNSLYSLAAQEKEWHSEALPKNDAHAGWAKVQEKLGRKDIELDEQSIEERLMQKLLEEDATRRQIEMRSDTLAPRRKGPAIPPSGSNKSRLKHAKSVEKHGSVKVNGVLADTYIGGKPPDLDILNGFHKVGKISSTVEREEAEAYPSHRENEWKMRVEMLEEELREAAAIEVSLFSIVAEHSSSVNKVHAPARRLSRFYKNACRTKSQAKRASAARTAVSGLILVSKACGNDVTRLTFWLSNSIMLRSTISQIAAELPHFNEPRINSNGGKLSDTARRDGQRSKSIDESDDLEDVLTFLIALERVESWLFSRIVESIWWQTFTPHMQPTVAKGSNRERAAGKKKTSSRRNYMGSHEQASFSIELWKKAFKDACERLCPIQAGGHECGCLSALVILVMQQLVNRLDVAMFNAILRESAKDMPTDPVSDPISDSKVLPVQPGKASFGAGAQLKNIIGNWSRWLTDLFGLEDDSTDEGIAVSRLKPFKAFRLLHALSDLMMLPYGMLADASTRKEVCPMFGPAIIKRVLNNFVPDEFSPNPIPPYIIHILSAEESSDCAEEMITSFPYTATAIKYSPPPAALLTCVGEVGRQVLKSSRLSTIKKSYSSDEEVDELESPLTRIIPDSYQSSAALARLSLMPREKGGTNAIRYQLLREIWRDDD